MKTNLKRAATMPVAEVASAPQPSSSKRPQPAKTKASPNRAASPRGQSKQDRVVAMLQQKQGTTAAAVMKATGWQKHPVLGFFSGVVRKKLGLNLLSEKSDGKRVYRIVDGRPAKSTPPKGKRAA